MLRWPRPSAESILSSEPALLGGLLPPCELALRTGVLPFLRWRWPLSTELARSPAAPETEARPSGALRPVFSRTCASGGQRERHTLTAGSHQTGPYHTDSRAVPDGTVSH